MSPSGSPTVRRRRLAAELRKLREPRKAGEIARAMGWSPTKISRAESGRESLPPTEIEKLIDFYEVPEPMRGRLLGLAEDAVQRGWWEDYADALAPEYLEFIGLEAEAESALHWQSDVVAGLLQTEDYARSLGATFRTVDPTIPPSVHERFLEARMLRQARLTQEPVLRLSVVLDEAVLLRQVGGRGVMRAQLEHLVDMSGLPNVDLRVLPLSQNAGLHGTSFAIMRFGPQDALGGELGDVVSTESLNTEFYVQGEGNTHLYGLFFDALSKAALPPADSRHFINSVNKRARS